MFTKTYYIYILTTKYNDVLYTGVTGNLLNRTFQHKHHYYKGFTQRYNIEKLVYYEIFNDIRLAIAREKQIKKWRRQWKVNLIDKFNPEWRDLFDEFSYSS